MIDIRLSDNEQNVINAIYEHFYSSNKWPIARALRKKLGRKTVESVVVRKEPQLVQKFEDNGIECYRLTFHGVLICSRAKDDVQMLLQYISFLKKKFEENPEIQEITSTDVEESLKLLREQSIRLSVLIDLGHLWGGSASNLGRSGWKAGVPDDIEDIGEANSPEEYLKKRLKKEEERQKELEKLYSRRIDKFRLFSWLSFNINLWLVSYILYTFFPKALPITMVINIWFALYSISKILEDIFRKKVPFFSSEKVLDKIIWWVITLLISFFVGFITRVY
jgi:hypothetical protein